MRPNVAVMDCGSNSTRLLVSSPEGATLHREMRITRLSEGVDASRRLTEAALARTRQVLEEFGVIARRSDPCDIVVVATSAVRDAQNRQEFVEMARAASGGEVAVISGHDEARYSYLGATAHLPVDERAPVVLDIGGGSSEIALQWDSRLWGTSTSLGCVRVSERCLGTGVIGAVETLRARDFIDEELARAASELPPLTDLAGRVRLVGLAGTVATLAQLVSSVVEYDRAAVHHRVLTRDQVRVWRDRLSPLTPSQRATIPGMVPGREDVIVAGLLVLEGVMDFFGVSDLITSEDDILDGVSADVRSGRRPVTM